MRALLVAIGTRCASASPPLPAPTCCEHASGRALGPTAGAGASAGPPPSSPICWPRAPQARRLRLGGGAPGLASLTVSAAPLIKSFEATLWRFHEAHPSQLRNYRSRSIGAPTEAVTCTPTNARLLLPHTRPARPRRGARSPGPALPQAPAKEPVRQGMVVLPALPTRQQRRIIDSALSHAPTIGRWKVLCTPLSTIGLAQGRIPRVSSTEVSSAHDPAFSQPSR